MITTIIETFFNFLDDQLPDSPVSAYSITFRLEQSPGSCKVSIEDPSMFPFAKIWKTYKYDCVIITHNLRRKLHSQARKEITSSIIKSFQEQEMQVVVTAEKEAEGEYRMAKAGYLIQVL
jgi:hypothetical protein